MTDKFLKTRVPETLYATFLAEAGAAGKRLNTHVRELLQQHAQAVSTADALARIEASTTRAPLVVGGVPLAWEQEPLHLLLAGSTGTGKTTAVAELLDGLTARDDRAVIVDPNGAYLAQFGEPGDVVLNVFDKRSPGWSPFNEVRKPYDFDKIARSVVPDGHGPDAAWHFYSQVLIAEVMRALLRDGRGDTAALLEALTIWPAEKLHQLVAGTAAAGLFDKEAARALASTRFVLSSHLKPYDSLQPGAFSVRQWVESDGNAAKRLFITWREDMTASLAPLIAAWVDIVCTATLSLAPDPQRRLWLLLDELPSIGKIGSLEAALAELPDLTAFLCLAGAQPARRIALTPRARAARLAAIVE